MTETVPERMERRQRERAARKADRDAKLDASRKARIADMDARMDAARAPKGKLLADATPTQLLAELMHRRDNSALQAAPSRIGFGPGHRVLCVGIGTDHHADVLIHIDDLKELRSHVV